MPSFFLRLLGSVYIESTDKPISVDRYKALALLIYLAIENHTYSREALATLLWPDHNAESARAGLRRALVTLKDAFGTDDCLIADRKTISLNKKFGLWVDVNEFRDLLQRCQNHSRDRVCSYCLSWNTQAVKLYRGDFLAGFSLPDSQGFDEWQFFKMEELRQEYIHLVERLTNYYAELNEFQGAIEYGMQWLKADPINEMAHRHLMGIYMQSGQYGAALRQYQNCINLLEKNLGIPPNQETIALYERIIRR